MKKTTKIATLAIALFAGVSGSAFANGTYRAEPAPVTPEAAPAPRPYNPPTPVPVAKSDVGYYVSGAAGVGLAGTQDYETGYVLNAAFGYNFNPIRVEAAAGYQHHELKNFSNFNVGFWSLLANAYYDFDAGSGIKPYVGGGLGVANTDRSWTDSSDTNFAWQVGGGLGFKVGDQTTLDIRYRYFRPVNGNMDFQFHNITAGIRYQF